MQLADFRLVIFIEEGRAAIKSTHQILAICFLFPSKEFLPISFKIKL
jgi:hypothetical protein